MFKILFITLVVFNITMPQHVSSDKGGCKWKGTAPFCGSNYCDSYDEHAYPSKEGFKSSTADGFGATCWTGKKVLCCKGLKHNIKSELQTGLDIAGVYEVAFKATIQRCKVEEDSSSNSEYPSGKTLKCIDEDGYRNSWEIYCENDFGYICRSLLRNGKTVGLYQSGIIGWYEPTQWDTIHGENRRWFRVNN